MEAALSMSKLRKPLILVAEDDKDVQILVAFRLELAGYEVVTADDGEQALQLALERHPDLCVLDVMMPKMSGLEVTQRLREHKDTQRLPIILLTARVSEEDVHRGFAAGADDYVKKPFSPQDLQTRVEAFLGRRGA